MAKDLIIGGASNYNWDQLKYWVNSIKKTGFNGDIVLVATNMSAETVNKLVEKDVKVYAYGNRTEDGGIAKSENNIPPHVERFLFIWDYLRKNQGVYRFVVVTDTRDVIFQKDPFVFMENNNIGRSPIKLLAPSEAMYYKDEPWNRDNIIKCFGQMYYDQICDNEVLNVGTLAGRAGSIKDLTAAIFQMSLNRADWVADQAAYNIMMGWRQYNRTSHIARLKDAWACNLHVTNKPDQMSQFGPYLLEPRPTFENGLVVNENKTPFCVVHQYDRVPELKNYYEEKYGVANVLTFRTDN